MVNNEGESHQFSNLRERAEIWLAQEAVEPPELTQDEARKLVHELRTHQIELEMQNEELRRTQNELIEARDRYSDLYDFAPVGYVTVSSKGLILEANLTLCKMLNAERRYLMKQPFSSFIVPDDQDIYYRHRRELLGSECRGTCQLRFLQEDAEPLWTEMDSILIQLVGEDEARLRTTIKDISHRKQVEEQLRQSQKMEAIGTLTGGIAHDFNNLLMGILGAASILERSLESGSDELELARMIEGSGRRAMTITKALLDFARQGKLKHEAVDVHDVMDDVISILQHTIDKRIVISKAAMAATSLVMGDSVQIEQALLNIALNARDAMPEGGELRLETKYSEANTELPDGHEGVSATGNLAVAISDSGIGMAEGIIARAFDPFFTTKDIGKGTGLGLASSLGIVQNHGGWIDIESEVGKGTTVTVYLPTTAEGVYDAQLPAPTETLQNPSFVLVVDDVETVRVMTKAMLIELGHEVALANSGQDALQMYEDRGDEIDIVVLDMSMPGMDGRECFRKLREMDPEVKVLISSGHLLEKLGAQLMEEGVAGLLQKPFTVNELGETLQQAILATGYSQPH